VEIKLNPRPSVRPFAVWQRDLGNSTYYMGDDADDDNNITISDMIDDEEASERRDFRLTIADDCRVR